jgi:hypothetical protein
MAGAMSVQMNTRAHSHDEAARTQLEKDPLSMVHGFGPSLQYIGAVMFQSKA